MVKFNIIISQRVSGKSIVDKVAKVDIVRKNLS